MSKKNIPAKKKKRRSSAAIWCIILGVLILLVVIAACITIYLPRYVGFGTSYVVNGSMDREIPVGSMAFIRPVDGKEVAVGDIIAFTKEEGLVIVNRVVNNSISDGVISTKGDISDEEDVWEVTYDELLGVVTNHIPILGQVLMLLLTGIGKTFIACFAACGMLLIIVAGRLE